MKTVFLIVILCSCVSSIAGQLGTGLGGITGSLLGLGLLSGLAGFGRNSGSGQSFLLAPERQQTFAHQQPLAFYGSPYWVPSKFCNKKNWCGQFSLAL